MKLTSWNIRGLNSLGKYRLIKNMIQQEKPQVFFMQGTKCSSTTLGQTLAKAWLGIQAVAMDSSRASVDSAIVWDEWAITLTSIHVSKNFIQSTFHITGTNVHGHLTNVYFPQEEMHKIDILNTLSLINSNRTHPLWTTGGDFNMITKMEEKRGGTTKLGNESIHLKNFIQNDWLIDMPFNNGIYTWNNKRVGTYQIASQLDRFFLSDNAIHLRGDFSASILPLNGSDHWPISL